MHLSILNDLAAKEILKNFSPLKFYTPHAKKAWRALLEAGIFGDRPIVGCHIQQAHEYKKALSENTNLDFLYFDTIDKSDPQVLAALIHQCDLVVTHNTLEIQIALSLQKPVIAVKHSIDSQNKNLENFFDLELLIVTIQKCLPQKMKMATAA